MYKINQIKLDALYDTKDNLKKKISKIIHTNNFKLIKIIKKSIDARNKNQIFCVYEVVIDTKENIKLSNNIFSYEEKKYVFPEGTKKDVVIVGSGPCGLFAGLLLSENGCNVTIIERGKKLEQRKEDVEKFWHTGVLDPNSNVQFGEGGAGTFSDGKLNTLIKDERLLGKKVLEVFVENGAPKEILYDSKPHIGTDILFNVVKNIRNKILSFGGIIRYETTLTNIFYENSILKSIEVNNNEIIDCDNLILALGHSARDTFRMLYENGIEMQTKPFAVGVRVEHNQNNINLSQYGSKYKDILPPSSYKLTYQTKKGRGVYSFCMCPGGYVVNASSTNNMLAINGMSYYKRNSENANSAIIVTINENDYGNKPLDGLLFQENLERKAYEVGQGKIPTTKYSDYLKNIDSKKIGMINPIMKGNYFLTNINEIFPEYINESIKEAMEYFGDKIEGFNSKDTLLSAVESRTSSPVKIIRDENFESNIKGIYPSGEGAGYAGGITSSAIDGIKVAESIFKK